MTWVASVGSRPRLKTKRVKKTVSSVEYVQFLLWDWINGIKYIISTFIFLLKKFNLRTPLKLELNSIVDLSNPLKEFSKTQNVHTPQSKRAIRTGLALENDKVYKN